MDDYPRNLHLHKISYCHVLLPEGIPHVESSHAFSFGHILGYQVEANSTFAEVYDKIDVKMDQRRLKQREKKMREQIKAP